MDRKKLFNALAVLIVFIFLANLGANKFYWYSSIWYFDIIMHFLGGLWVGLLGLFVFSGNYSTKEFIFRIVITVLIIGLGWEVYEFLVDKAISKNVFNLLDSSADIFFDISGSLAAVSYALRNYGKETK